MNNDDRAQLAAVVARLDGMEKTMDRVVTGQDDIKRELSEIRGARRMAWGILGAVGGLSGVAGYLLHKINIPGN